MHRGVIVVVATLAVVASVRGTSHLVFDNATSANVTRKGCGSTDLCLEMPDNCDPDNITSSCLFASLNANASASAGGFDLHVNLSRNSDFVAFGLTQNFTTSDTQLFVCANVSGNFVFRTVTRSANGTLTANERTTTRIRNRLNQNRTQCEFIIPNVDTTMMGEMLDGTTAVVVLGNGTLAEGTVNNFNLLLNSGRVNLTDSQGTVTLNINRDGCGTSKLCVETPEQCDPRANGGCLFTSLDATATVNQSFNISVELAGKSQGYIAVGFTPTPGEGVTDLYLCGINGSDNSFLVLARDLNTSSNSLTPAIRNVVDVRGTANGTAVECTFTIVGVNATAATRQAVSGTGNSVVLGTGPLNGGQPGSFTANTTSRVLNITNPTANVNGQRALNISRQGCNTTNLCRETPQACDPLLNPMCQFVSCNSSAPINNIFNLTCRLSGYSTGYFALGLSPNASQSTSTVFACGTDTNGNFFRTFTGNNTDGVLIPTNRSFRDAVVAVSNRSIECSFTIVDINGVANRETDGTSADIILANGTLNGNALNPMNILLTNRVNFTVSGNTTTNGAAAGRSSYAMLMLLSLVTVLAAFQA